MKNLVGKVFVTVIFLLIAPLAIIYGWCIGLCNFIKGIIGIEEFDIHGLYIGAVIGVWYITEFYKLALRYMDDSIDDNEYLEGIRMLTVIDEEES